MRSMFAVLLLCSPALAGDCRPVYSTAYKVAPVYAVKQAFYTPTYATYGIVAVEQPYYSVQLVGEDARQRAQKKDLNARLLSLEETARQTNESLNSLKQLQFNFLAGLGANSGVQTGQLQNPQASQAPVAEDPVIPILRSHCASCHTGEGSKGSFRMFDVNGTPVKFTPLDKFLIESVTNDGSMPPQGQGTPVDDKGYQLIRKWYEPDRAAARAQLKAQRNQVPVPSPPVQGDSQ